MTDENDDDPDDLPAHVDHLDMLCDSERNRRFHRALARTMCALAPDRRRVLDIGTGSGLLGLLAAKHGATNVVACESNLVCILHRVVLYIAFRGWAVW
jgi:predicted RNA methylase